MDNTDAVRDDAFSTLHPALTFLYFFVVIGCAMFIMHPAFLALSLFGGVAYHGYLTRGGSRTGTVVALIWALVLPTLVNPLFNHSGSTVLFHLWWDTPITLEAVLYGLLTGVMLASVVAWFACYRVVMTSDKTIYLFGKAFPALSLAFSMTLQFVPRFLSQFGQVLRGQRCIGRDVSSGTLRDRMNTAAKTTSIMATWALESSVETADTMRSRGYGLRGRTSFFPYRFDGRDRRVAVLLLACTIAVLLGLTSGGLEIAFYPAIKVVKPGAVSVLACGAFAILCVFPLVVDCVDEARWRYLRSMI